MGLVETAGCSGNCYCAGGILGTESSGTCVAPTACGGPGERACCAFETSNQANGGGCDDGSIEVRGCTGNCLCADGVLGASSSGTCQAETAATPCGGLGERACCSATSEGPNCDAGLIEVAGCSGDCLCGGANPLLWTASGTCHQPRACGGDGERACCSAERASACDPGLREVPGCSGDCFCGASLTGIVDDDGLGTSSGTCAQDPVGSMQEPSIGFSDTAAVTTCSQLGYADLHMHLFGDIAHGGGVLAGQPCPRSEGTYCVEAFRGKLTPGIAGPGQTKCGTPFCDSAFDVNDALRACYGTDQDLQTKSESALATPDCPSWLGDCGAAVFHGDHLFDDPVGAHGTMDGADSSRGAPVFNAWPQWTSTTHQQNYYKWLERAWRGGLRLIVQFAVNNTALCMTNKRLGNVDCDNSMAFIDQQLQAAYDLERFIDLEAGSGIDNDEGWFRIVKTPAEGRSVLASGKLAVVLGIEVDHPFNCAFPSEQCSTVNDNIVSCAMTTDTLACRDPNDPSKSSAQWVREQVDYYHDVWGVRHMFPIHNFDNAFGGAATWQSMIEVGNRWVAGHWYKTRDCASEGYNFKLGQEGTSIQAIISALGFGQVTTVPLHPEAVSCNAFGLFPLGKVLIERMVDRGMIIDIDHMSSLSLEDTVNLVRGYRVGGYPLAASHALFTDLNVPQVRHERMRTAAQLAELEAMGGMLGVMLKDDALDTDRRGRRTTLDYEPSGVLDDCRHSSKTFLQALTYAREKVGTSALGSDFDGMAGHFGPRFGSAACGGDAVERSAQLRANEMLQYPFEIEPFGTFDQQVSGLKAFDYNVDGLAHVGLLPDFVADLAVVGGGPAQLDPLMRSAEAYLRMWERARGEEPKDCNCVDDDSDTVEDCRDRCPGVDDRTAAGGCPTESPDAISEDPGGAMPEEVPVPASTSGDVDDNEANGTRGGAGTAREPGASESADMVDTTTAGEDVVTPESPSNSDNAPAESGSAEVSGEGQGALEAGDGFSSDDNAGGACNLPSRAPDEGGWLLLVAVGVLRMRRRGV